MDNKHANSILKSLRGAISTRQSISFLVFFWIATSLLLLAITNSVYAQEESKIAVVDVQYVLDHSVAVARLREAIDKLSEKLHKEMSDKESALKNAEAALIKKRDQMKQDQFDSEVNAFYKKVSEAQHEMQQKKAKLEQAHAEAIGVVHDSTLKIISELSKEKKLQVVLPTSQILYADEVLHMTSNVVAELNKQVKSIPLNYK